MMIQSFHNVSVDLNIVTGCANFTFLRIELPKTRVGVSVGVTECGVSCLKCKLATLLVTGSPPSCSRYGKG